MIETVYATAFRGESGEIELSEGTSITPVTLFRRVREAVIDLRGFTEEEFNEAEPLYIMRAVPVRQITWSDLQ